MKNKTCGECKYHIGTGCHLPKETFIIMPEIKACRHFTQKPKQTVFDYITQSEEKLAECSVCKMDSGVYYSHITGGFYATENKAIAATIEELKKEIER